MTFSGPSQQGNELVHRDPTTGEVVALPGYEGVPFRGDQVPNLREDDPNQPELVYDAKVRIFDLSDEEQKEDYEEICDMVAKGTAMISEERIEFVEERRNWMVFIRYIAPFAEMPGRVNQRARLTQDGQITFRGRGHAEQE